MNGWGYFTNIISFKAGNGSCICFWHDVWCRAATLKFAFPELYLIARDKEALVSDYLDGMGPVIH